MIQNEVAQHVLKHRVDFFKSAVALSGRLRLNEKTVVDGLASAMDVIANQPSFLMQDVTKLDPEAVRKIYDGKYRLPFEKFSIVSSTNRDNRFTVLTVEDRAPNGAKTRLRVNIFLVSGGSGPKYNFILPFEVEVLGLQGTQADLVFDYDLDTNVTEGQFEKLAEAFFKAFNVDGDSESALTNYSSAMFSALSQHLAEIATSVGYSFRPAPATPRKVAQAASEKKSFFEYHVVELSASAPASESKGGTHASPRQHQRRGHWRHYKSGKRIFIHDMVVGSAENGIIEKDYSKGQQ